MNNNGKTPKPANPPFPILNAESVDTPELGNPVIVATPFCVFGAKWLGRVDSKAWTLTDAYRLMDDLAGEESEE